MKINIKPFLLFGFVTGALLATGNPIFSQLAYLLGAVIVLSFLWTWYTIRWVKVERHERSHRTQVGRIHEEHVTVTNYGVLPKLWLEVRDLSDLPNHQAGRVLELLPGQEGERNWIIRTVCSQRGRFTLGPIQLHSSDPFGIFENQRALDVVEHLVVWPQTVDLPTFAPPIGRLSGGDALRRRTHHITTNVAGVREYHPGDSFNRIHWKTSARHNRLIVKEFELDPSADIWLFLDMDRHTHYGTPRTQVIETPLLPIWATTHTMQIEPTTEEYAIVVAASIAKHFTQRGKAVGVITYGQKREVLVPDRGERQLNKILEALAVIRAQGDIPISEVLAAESQTFGRNVTVVVITSSVWVEWVSLMRDMARRSLQPLGVLIDAQSFGAPVNNDKVKAALMMSNVPIYTVKKDDNLASALSQTVVATR
jgi:uncharacterized protein (DUF58 family)